MESGDGEEGDYLNLLRMLEDCEDENAPAPGLPLTRSCLARRGWSGKGRVRRV